MLEWRWSNGGVTVNDAGMMMEYGRLQERYLQIEKDLSQVRLCYSLFS